MKVKFGAIDFALPGKRVGNIKLAHELGLEGLQIIYLTPEDESFMLDYRWCREYYMEMGERYHIRFPSTNVSDFDRVGMVHPRNTEKGKYVYDTIDRTLDMAAAMKMDMVLYPSFMDGEIQTEEDLIVTAEALRYACKEAQMHKITVTSENTLPKDRIRKLAELVNCPNFKVSYDTQNYWRVAKLDQVDILDFLQKSDLLYPEVHVKDGMDACISSKLIGEGNANVLGSIQYLKNTGYEGWLHFENYYWKRPLCDESDDVFQLLKRDVSILKNCWRT